MGATEVWLIPEDKEFTPSKQSAEAVHHLLEDACTPHSVRVDAFDTKRFYDLGVDHIRCPKCGRHEFYLDSGEADDWWDSFSDELASSTDPSSLSTTMYCCGETANALDIGYEDSEGRNQALFSKLRVQVYDYERSVGRLDAGLKENCEEILGCALNQVVHGYT